MITKMYKNNTRAKMFKKKTLLTQALGAVAFVVLLTHSVPTRSTRQEVYYKTE